MNATRTSPTCAGSGVEVISGVGVTSGVGVGVISGVGVTSGVGVGVTSGVGVGVTSRIGVGVTSGGSASTRNRCAVCSEEPSAPQAVMVSTYSPSGSAPPGTG